MLFSTNTEVKSVQINGNELSLVPLVFPTLKIFDGLKTKKLDKFSLKIEQREKMSMT